MIFKTRYDDVEPYITKDGSVIRELMHPRVHSNKKMSIAQAVVPQKSATILHRHHASEEIYHVTQGTGEMTLSGQIFSVTEGDTIFISPGSSHCIRNTGKSDLVIFCCCSPPYSHEDTEILQAYA